MPNWAEQVTAISTAVGAVGLLSTVELAVAAGLIDANAPEAFACLYRELDSFEQMGALEWVGAINFDVLPLLLGPRLIDRWEMWKPSIDAMPGDYPMFRDLVVRCEQPSA